MHHKKQILLPLSEWQEDCAVCRELMGNNKSMLAIVEHENINININTGKTLISFVVFFCGINFLDSSTQ